MVAWGPIIGAGINVLGGLFGKKKQTTTSTVDYQQMVASAEAAGFNPLTVLRNGGSAGFTTTTGPTVSQMPEALGNLGGLLGDALQEKLDPIQAKKREIDTLMTDVQLKEARALSSRPGSFYRPVEWSGTKVSNQFVPRLGAKSHKQTAAVAIPKLGEGTRVPGENPTVSSMGLGGERYGWFHSGLTDANQFENIYGDSEIGSTIYGGAKILADGVYSIYRNGKSAYEDAYSSYRGNGQSSKSITGKRMQIPKNPGGVRYIRTRPPT